MDSSENFKRNIFTITVELIRKWATPKGWIENATHHRHLHILTMATLFMTSFFSYFCLLQILLTGGGVKNFVTLFTTPSRKELPCKKL